MILGNCGWRFTLPAAVLAAILAAAGCERDPAGGGGSAATEAKPLVVPSAAEVTMGASDVVSDTVTTGKIMAAIAADSGMKDADISVSTSQGIVALTGSAKSQDQINVATNLAQRQRGVLRVENSVTTK